MPSETKGSSAVEALLKEKRKFAPPKEFGKRAAVNRPAVYRDAAKNPARFWERFARELDWFKPWKTTLVWKAPSPGGFSIVVNSTVSATSTDPALDNNTATEDTTVLP